MVLLAILCRSGGGCGAENAGAEARGVAVLALGVPSSWHVPAQQLLLLPLR